MLTLFANPHLPTSPGNANSCSRPTELKVAVAAAAAELLRLACEFVDGVMLLNCSDKETPAMGGASGEPAARHMPPALPLCKPLVLAVVLKTALSYTSEAPCERDLTERDRLAKLEQ
jgi:hypothetical protein